MNFVHDMPQLDISVKSREPAISEHMKINELIEVYMFSVQ